MTIELSLRSATVARLALKGISIPAHLPEFDGHLSRSEEEVITRLLCLHATAAVAHGLRPDIALDWVAQEGLANSFTEDEAQVLRGGLEKPLTSQAQIEAMFALAWALNLYPDIDLWAECDDRFAWKLPDLKVKEPSASIRRASKLRTNEEVLRVADLAYCLDWAVTDALQNGAALVSMPSPGDLKERRQAFEWLTGDEDWSDVPVDT